MTNSQSSPIRMHKVWTNPEINVRIYAQLCHLNFEQLLEKPLFERFYRYSECVMHKLHATLYHLENYQRLEQFHYAKCLEQYKTGNTNTYECFDLIFELEACLFQIKSSLDMLVKLMIPILGKRVKTQTFAAKGDHLVNGLEQYKKQKTAPVPKVQEFIDMLKWAKQDWIEKVVDLRDELNHHKGLTHYWFEPVKIATGEIVPLKPKFKGMDTLDFMEDACGRNLVFHQDFAAMALSLVAPACMALTTETRQNRLEPYGDLAPCLKWTWGLLHSDQEKPSSSSEE